MNQILNLTTTLCEVLNLFLVKTLLTKKKTMMLTTSKGLLLTALIAPFVLSLVVRGAVKGVTYDDRSLIINGERMLLFSGSIHYPPSPPEVQMHFFLYIIVNKGI